MRRHPAPGPSVAMPGEDVMSTDTIATERVEGTGARSGGTRRADLDPEPNGVGARVLIGAFVVIPLLALLAAIPLAWGWGLGWHDIVLALAFYLVSGLGISMGFHRYFTHGSFKAVRPFKVVLAIAGSLGIEGPVLVWVADHRRH